MKAVVLGSSGFIGSRIVNHLNEYGGIECAGFNSRNCNLLELEQCETVLSPLVKDAVVIFSAGRHRMRSDSFETFCQNLQAVENLISIFARAQPQKFIFLSSVEVYGLSRQLPISEDTEISPETRYGIGKYAAELLLERWARNEGQDLAILRLPGVYGPGDTSGGLICNILKCINERREFSFFGDGKDLRDYVFVEDIARLVLGICHSEIGDIKLNIATGESLSLKEIFKIATEVFGECRFAHKERSKTSQDIVFDVSTLKKMFPEFKMTELRDGMEQTKRAGE